MVQLRRHSDPGPAGVRHLLQQQVYYLLAAAFETAEVLETALDEAVGVDLSTPSGTAH